MDSPVGKEPMVALELEHIEVDYCPESEGIWLDEGELELLLDDPDAMRDMLADARPGEAQDARGLKCPRCRKRMRKWAFGDEGATVVIDGCPHNHGFWFDRGELRRFLALKGNSERIRQVIAFLNDMFPLPGEEASDTEPS